MSILRSTGLAALLIASASAQSARPVAIVNARVLTLAGDPIENATILIEDGRIEAVGAKVRVPPGSERIDAAGGTVMPGLVSAFSRAGLTGQRRSTVNMSRRFSRRFRGFGPTSSSKPVNAAATKVAESLYARQDVFGELLECGVTTLAIAPTGSGFPGLSASVDPSVAAEEGFVVDDDVYVFVGMGTGSSTKQLLGKSLEAAKKVLDERKKPKEPEKKKGEQPASQPTSKPTEGEKPGSQPETPPKPKEGEEPPKPEDKPASQPTKKGEEGEEKEKPKEEEKKKDPNAEVLADLLDGARHAFVAAGSATEIAHYAAAIDEHRFPMTIVVPSHDAWSGRVDQAADTLKKLDASVLVPAELASGVYSSVLVDPAAELRRAGIEVGFLIGDSKDEVRGLFFHLLELVRHGASRDDVLRAVTVVPAKMLGIDGEVGTIEVGKRADLLLFDADPLDPTSRLVQVFHGGEAVREEATR